MRVKPVVVAVVGGMVLGSAVGLSGLAEAQEAPAEVAPDAVVPGDARPVIPVEVEEEEDPSRRSGGLLAQHIEHAAQRATAAELSGELDPLLGPDGLPSALGSAKVRAALRGVATRCDLLSHSLSDPVALRLLYETQARVYNALVQDAAAHGESVEVARGLGQLRAAAGRLDDLEANQAAAAGGYWQMLADLIDAKRTIDDPADRRVFVRELLSRYVDDFGDDPTLADAPPVDGYVLDARVALARLLDEAGEQRAAVEALGPIAEQDPRSEQHDTRHDERRAEAREVMDRGGAIGRRLELDLPLASGGRWNVADHAGQPVLVHYYASGQGDSAAAIAALSRAIEAADLGGFSLVSLDVGPGAEGAAAPPWPVALVDSDQSQALMAYGLTSVPMYVWLDAAGRVWAIGKTLDVIRRFPAPVEEAPADDAAEAENEADTDADVPAPDAGSTPGAAGVPEDEVPAAGASD